MSAIVPRAALSLVLLTGCSAFKESTDDATDLSTTDLSTISCTGTALKAHQLLGQAGNDSYEADLAPLAAGGMGLVWELAANRMRIPLVALAVRVTGEIDVRGTMCVDSALPVGFQRMDMHISLQTADDVDEAKRTDLLELAEHCCVVLQTLRAGVPVNMHIEDVALNRDAASVPGRATTHEAQALQQS